MMPVIGWKVYYADGSVVSSEDMPWEDVPHEVQVIVLYHEPPYRTMMAGEDEYVIPGETEPKLGKWMDTDEFYALQQMAFEDRELP